MTTLDRRAFLRRGAAVGVGAAFAAPTLAAITSHPAWARNRDTNPPGWDRRPSGQGYGPLVRMPDQDGRYVLALPDGFSYTTFSRTGAMMSDGYPVPRNLDGMGCFPGPRKNTVVLVRNHEVRNAPSTGGNPQDVQGPNDTKFDPLGVGGTTSLLYDLEAQTLLSDWTSLNGTIVNCAGGYTVDGRSWLTCEETTAGTPRWGKNHGWNFLVRATADMVTQPAVAIEAMGRFPHEASAADPRTGVVYQTEDNGNISGFYRYLPNNPLDLLQGGRLQMLRVVGRPKFDTRKGQVVGEMLDVDWVTIDDPSASTTPTWVQGYELGGARFNRLEGLWYGMGSMWFTATEGGDVWNGDTDNPQYGEATGYPEGYGQIWKYTPTGDDAGKLTLFFESPGGTVLDSPDNLTVSPKGAILLCEDDASSDENLGFVDESDLAPGISEINRLVGIAPNGEAFSFALNTWSDAELAGACFSPDGHTLFVNVFGGGDPDSGMTCAITGPWARGAL
jgi:uncharacterized protein